MIKFYIKLNHLDIKILKNFNSEDETCLFYFNILQEIFLFRHAKSKLIIPHLNNSINN